MGPVQKFLKMTTGFFQKCQQYLTFRGSNTSQNYAVNNQDFEQELDSEPELEVEPNLASRFSFHPNYKKVSTEDKRTKYSDSYQNMGSKDDFYNAAGSASNSSNDSRRKPSEDWGWNEENWSDDTKPAAAATTKSTTTTAKKSVKSKGASKSETKNNDDLLIDFGSDKNKAKKNPDQQEDSWASWEN